MSNIDRRSLIALAGIGAAALVGCGPAPAEPEGFSDVQIEGDASAASTDFGSDGKLRVGMEVSYVPFNWQTSEESENTIPIENVEGTFADGYDVAVTKRVAEALDLEPYAVKIDFEGLIDSLRNGKIDLIIAGMTDTPERAESIDFSDPYYVSAFGLLVMKGSPYENATSLADFDGAAVLGVKASLLDTLIDEIPGVNHLTPPKTVPEQLDRLVNGTCDAITFDIDNAQGMLAANPDLVPIIFGEGKGFSQNVPVNIGIAKGHEDILEKINQVLSDFTPEERSDTWNKAMERQPS